MPLTTATTTTITAPMSLSSSPTTTSNPSPDAAMQPFTPGHCLLCPNSFPSFDDSVLHMQKSHGLFVPHRQHLAVDLETLFRYLHLIIFGYRECIQCKTTKTTVQAIQQHMTGKGHCKFDISEPDSEFAEFYDFSEPEDDSESDIEERIQDETATTSSRQKPLLADKESIHLPSGRIILRKSSAQAEPSFLTRLHRRRRASASRIEYSVPESDDDEDEASKEGLDSDIDNTRALSRREKREKAMVKFQLTNMSANDRSSLMHLSAPQQRSILATQHKQEKKAQKEESRRRSHIDRKGNKNLYAGSLVTSICLSSIEQDSSRINYVVNSVRLKELQNNAELLRPDQPKPARPVSDLQLLLRQLKLYDSSQTDLFIQIKLNSSINMAGSPREQWERLQVMLQNRARAGGGGGGGFRFGGGAPMGGSALAIAVLVAGGYALSASLFNVDGGHRAIKYSRISGVKKEIYSEGTHIQIPWIETPVVYDVRAKPRNVASLTGTKDLQMVNITCRVLSRPRIEALPQIYRTLGKDFDERVLPSIVNEVLKSVVAQFNASQLITQRENVARLVRDNLARRAALFNITLDDVSLTHLAFSPEFTAAVEAKQVAQQEAQRAAFLVDKARQEKQATIVRAQGEARSAELIGDAIKKSKSYVELRRIENARNIAQLLQEAGGRNKLYLDTQGLGLNVNASPEAEK